MQENKRGFEVLDWRDMFWLQYQLHHYSDPTEFVILSLAHILLFKLWLSLAPPLLQFSKGCKRILEIHLVTL